MSDYRSHADLSSIIAQLSGRTATLERESAGTGGGGGGGADKHYLHLQGSASAVWTVAHGLGKNPSVSVLDSSLEETEGEVLHVDLNNLTITFAGAMSGRAALN